MSHTRDTTVTGFYFGWGVFAPPPPPPPQKLAAPLRVTTNYIRNI